MAIRTALKRTALVGMVAATLTRAASAADIPVVWDGDTNTDWSEGDNWVGGSPPPADDHAKITGTFTNQPTLTGATAVGGIWITGLGQALGADENDQILTINGNTIDGQSTMAVLFKDSTGFNAAINNKVLIASDGLTIRNDTDNNLSFSSATSTTPVINVATSGHTLTFSSNGAGSITTGHIGGAGNVTIKGTGAGAVITNSNATSFTGQLTIERGILQTNTVNNSAVNGKLGNSALSVIMGSSGNTGTLLYNGGSASSTKRFTLTTSGTGVFDLTPSANAVLTLSGVIDGGGEMQIKGDGTDRLLLTGVNTYSGGTRLISGTLSLGRDTVGAITSGAVGTGTLTLAGGTLTTSAARTLANPIVIDGSTTISTATFATTLSGSLTSDVITANTDAITLVGTTGTLSLNGDLSGYHGTINFDRATSPAIQFSVPTVNLQNARLVMNGSTASSGNTIRLPTSGAAVDAVFRIGELSGDGGVFNPQTASTSQTYIIGSRNTDASFGGIFHARDTRPVNITKVGTGSLTLTGANYYFGGTTTVSAGTLIAGTDAISSTTMDGTNSTLTITSNVFSQTGHGLTNDDRIAFTGGSGALASITQYWVVNATANTFQISTSQGGASLTGITNAAAGVTEGIQAGAFGGGASAIVLNDANTDDNDVNLATGGAFTIERAVNVTNNGTGVTSIGGVTNNDSTFSGLVTVNKDLTVAQLGTIASSNTLHVTGGITSGGGSQTITFGRTVDATDYLGAVNIETTGISNGSGTLVVVIDGNKTTFAANNTYSGGTTINSGILLANFNGVGSSTGTGGVLLNGGTLGGIGKVGGAVTFDSTNGGTLAPGTSAGTLTLDTSVVMNSMSTLAYELAANDTTPGGGVNDLLVVGTDVTLDGTLNVTEIAGFGTFAADAVEGDKWKLITYSGTLTNSGLNLGSMPLLSTGLGYSIQLDNTLKEVNLLIMAVPEASAFAAVGLVGLLSVGAIWIRRRRNEVESCSAGSAN
ncbi:MAG: autotransporter-associated beta strand repeat-containing protein [Pirellulales bacterium]